MFTLLDEVKKRYPQGRTAVAGMENMIADLGEKVVRDTEERKKRKEEREVAEWTEVGRRDIA
jgi:endonuclease YncB( thermonuclease family)